MKATSSNPLPFCFLRRAAVASSIMRCIRRRRSNSPGTYSSPSAGRTPSNSSRRFSRASFSTNKVKYLIGKTFLIHSLDRFELADELQKRAQKAGWTADCLIEVNIGSELSKSGFSLEDAPAAYERLKSYQNIRIKGLMAMLPLSDDRAMLAALCKKMRALYDALRAEDGNIEHLSMGMSGDWRLCAENGSNMIRLGTSLFGPRNYPAPAANVQG